MKYLDTFTGYGGFTLGIQRAYNGHILRNRSSRPTHRRSEKDIRPKGIDSTSEDPLPTCIGFSEIDKYATSVYQKHFPNHKPYGDITQLDPKTLPDFDLLTGGFPCQAFSIAGKRRGFDDTRGTLFFDIARILREKKPRWFVLENVKGLLSHDDGRTFKTIISTLVELGYGVEWQVLNAKNYGVPQNRERVFIVGNLGGERTGQVFPLGHADGNSKVADTKKPSVRELQDSPPITTQGGLNIRGVFISESEFQIRRLTPTECERLMGLPDGWLKYGADGKEISDSQRYKMAGNGVVVNVVEAIMSKIFSL